jgi:hypothetical protein
MDVINVTYFYVCYRLCLTEFYTSNIRGTNLRRNDIWGYPKENILSWFSLVRPYSEGSVLYM